MNSRQYALFRILLGGFCLVHFAMLLPYVPELFSAAGMIGNGGLSALIHAFPNILAVYDAPWFAVALVAAAAIASLCLAAGWHDKKAALLIACCKKPYPPPRLDNAFASLFIR